jgi:acyl-CoA reductase-like NAD-dependent aldehyde dehydrogenase
MQVYTSSVVASLTEKRLLIGGEWIETGAWAEIRSPYSGDVVGRVAKAGAEEARRAVDAAEKAMQAPLPAHKRRSSSRSRRRSAAVRTRWRG